MKIVWYDMTEITLIEVPAMNMIGTTKTGTYALIPELIMKIFANIQKKGAHRRPAALPLPRDLPGRCCRGK